MKKNELVVSAIKNGSVIDHLNAGSAIRVINLLKLDASRKRVTLGLNLPSASMGLKDLIKIEDREITDAEAELIALFAPKATINIIRDYQCETKFPVSMPNRARVYLLCPNPRCITNHEPVSTEFRILQMGNRVELECHYCGSLHDA